MWSYNNIDELYHYGVKGMKWRKRKKYDKYDKSDLTNTTKKLLTKRDNARQAIKRSFYNQDSFRDLHSGNKNYNLHYANGRIDTQVYDESHSSQNKNFNSPRRVMNIDNPEHDRDIRLQYNLTKYKALKKKRNNPVNRVKRALKKIGKKKAKS